MSSKCYTLGEGQGEGNGRWDDKIYPGCRTRLLEAEHFQGDCFTTSIGAFLMLLSGQNLQTPYSLPVFSGRNSATSWLSSC